jgi:hypothetical protein
MRIALTAAAAFLLLTPAVVTLAQAPSNSDRVTKTESGADALRDAARQKRAGQIRRSDRMRGQSSAQRGKSTDGGKSARSESSDRGKSARHRTARHRTSKHHYGRRHHRRSAHYRGSRYGTSMTSRQRKAEMQGTMRNSRKASRNSTQTRTKNTY